MANGRWLTLVRYLEMVLTMNPGPWIHLLVHDWKSKVRLSTKKQATHKFQDLRSKILDEADCVMFDEAAKCLFAEAYRAAYIVAWISAAQSLRRKFATMAERDDEMGRVFRDIQVLEKQDNPIDRFVLTQAEKVGMIAPDEAKKLGHVRQMRNIYAHPTGAGPTRLEVAAALDIVVSAVLSRPPLLRHGYVVGLVTSLFESRHFLDDVPTRVRDFAVGVSRRLHPDVLPYLFERLAERVERVVDDPESGLYLRRALEFGAAVLDENNPDLSAAQWSIMQLIQRRPRGSALLFSTPKPWRTLPDQARDMVLGHLVEPVGGTTILPPTPLGLRRARALAVANVLTGRQSERVKQATDRSPYAALRELEVPLSEYAPRLIADLRSHNWYVQNPAAETLRDAGPQGCAEVETHIQEQIGRNVLQAADGTAMNAESLILSILQGGEVWPRTFVEGLVLEGLVNDDGKFRLKERYLERVLRIALAHSEVDTIFRHLSERVRASDPRWGFRTPEYGRAQAIVGNVRDDVNPGLHPYLDALLEAIGTAEARAPTA